MKLSLLDVDLAGFKAWREEWRHLEHAAVDPSPYTTFAWLHAWVETYQPRRLRLAHMVHAHTGATAALGLLTVSPLRGLSFAGGGVTPHRALLCAAGHTDAAWSTLATWLRANRRAWSTLTASEVPQGAAAVPGARLTVHSTPCLTLPDSFDSYLASLPSKRRNDLRRRLRLAEQAGIEVRRVPVRETERAIADYLRLHHQRASVQSKNHSDVDERLARLLREIAATDTIDLAICELRHDGVRVAIGIHLEHGNALYPYSHGWDPGSARLAPGIVMALDFIRDATGRGLERIDMGPGEQDYKLALGALPSRRLALHASNRAIWARAVRSADASYGRVRR